SDFVGRAIQVLGINRDGPAGVLPPGYRGTFQLVFLPEVFGDRIETHFQVLLPAAADAPMDWNALKEASRPTPSPSDAWDACSRTFTAPAGPTGGGYQALLARNATALSRLGVYTGDVARLFAFELQKADAVPPAAVLDSAQDVFFPAPALDL